MQVYRERDWEDGPDRHAVHQQRVERTRDRVPEPAQRQEQRSYYREAPRMPQRHYEHESTRPPRSASAFTARQREARIPSRSPTRRQRVGQSGDRMDPQQQYAMGRDGGSGEYVIHVVTPEHRSSRAREGSGDGYDLRQHYFLRARGMADHDRLVAELRDETSRRTRQSVLDRERTDLRAMRDAWDELETLRERLGQVREDDDGGDNDRDDAEEWVWSRRRRPRRESGQDDLDNDDAGVGSSSRVPRSPSRRRRQKSRARGDEDGCCEKLLRFLREDAALQHSQWRQTRSWQEAVMRQLAAIQLQTDLPPPYPGLDNDTSPSHSRRRSRTSGELPADSGLWAHNPAPREALHVFHRPSSISGSGLHSRSRSRRRGGTASKPVRSRINISIGFMFLVDGKVIQSSEEDVNLLTYHYHRRPRTTKRNSPGPVYDDRWIISEMKKFYSTRVAMRRWVPPVRRLALAKMVRMEDGPTWRRPICTAQRWFLESDRNDSSYDNFQYAMDYPLPDEIRWMDKLERLVLHAERENDCVVWVYLFDRLNYRFLMFFIIVFLVISTGGGIAYGILLDDLSTGLTISTYVVGFIAIVTALWGTGEQLGVEKPDSYSYSFDTVYAEILHDRDGNIVDDAKLEK